jgi:hypothetical protein
MQPPVCTLVAPHTHARTHTHTRTHAHARTRARAAQGRELAHEPYELPTSTAQRLTSLELLTCGCLRLALSVLQCGALRRAKLVGLSGPAATPQLLAQLAAGAPHLRALHVSSLAAPADASVRVASRACAAAGRRGQTARGCVPVCAGVRARPPVRGASVLPATPGGALAQPGHSNGALM